MSANPVLDAGGEFCRQKTHSPELNDFGGFGT